MEEFKIGSNIRQRRKYIGKTQIQIADLIDVSKSQISKWENDISVPAVSSFIRLCEALNIRPEDLIEGNIEKDLIENKEQKEFWRKVIIYTLCVIIATFVIRFVFELFGFTISSEKEEYKKVILSEKLLNDGTWEVRQIVRSENDAIWADVLIHQKDGVITEGTVLELISTNGSSESNYTKEIDMNNDFVVHVYYEEDDIAKFTMVIIESAQID